MKIGTDQVPIIILCGGKGIFVDASGLRRNKALVPVAGLPMVAHVMRLYIRHGYQRFLLSTGGQSADFPRIIDGIRSRAFPKDVTVKMLETGEQTTTWPRIAACEPLLEGAPVFGISYCDVLADVDLANALQGHLAHGKILSLAAVFQPTRFRLLGLRPPDPLVRGFAEKPILRSDRINGGFYFARPELFDQVRNIPSTDHDTLSLEGKVLESLVEARQVAFYFVDREFRYLDAERDIEPMARLAAQVC